jgi:hypothetical protein
MQGDGMGLIERDDERYTDQERAAFAIWRVQFGAAPTVPLRVKGGALDPDAWCMEASAAALAQAEEIPGLIKDVPAPEWVREVVMEAVASHPVGGQ